MMESKIHRPYPYLKPEHIFDRVIKAVGGSRVDAVLDKSTSSDNADYFIRSEGVIAELKELRADVAEDVGLTQKLSHIYSSWADRGVVPVLYGEHTVRVDLLPEECRREVVRLFQRRFEGPIRKAARQIKATKALLGMGDAKGLLILVNEGANTLRPDWVLYLLHHITKGQHRSIDHVIYCTINNPVEGKGIPDQALFWISAKIAERRPIDPGILHRMQEEWRLIVDEEIGLGPRPVLAVKPDDHEFADITFQGVSGNQADHFVQPGHFYIGRKTKGKFYCDSIDGGIATMCLVESFLDGKLLQAQFTQRLVVANTTNYSKIICGDEISRLRKMLKRLKKL